MGLMSLAPGQRCLGVLPTDGPPSQGGLAPRKEFPMTKLSIDSLRDSGRVRFGAGMRRG